MATLTGQLINSTYLDLLWAPNSNAGITSSTLVTVCSGNGTATALSISTTQVQIGNINISGNTISSTNTNGNINLTPNGSGSVAISNFSASGNFTISGSSGSTVGQLRFLEPSNTGSTYVGFQAPTSISGNCIWTLPAADSTGTQAITSNGSKVLGFTSLPGGATALSFNSGVGITDANTNAVLTFTTTASAVNSVTLANAATGNDPKLTTNAVGLTISPNNGILTISGSSAVGAIKLYNSAGTHFTKLQSGTTTADQTYTLPTAVPVTSGMSLVSTTGGVMSWAVPSVTSVGQINPNLLHNGSMNIAQRGTSFTGATAITSATGNYLLDRWMFLTNGSAGAYTVSQSSIVPTSTTGPGATYSQEVLNVTLNKQFALFQLLEAKDVSQLLTSSIGGTLSLTLSATVKAAAGGNTGMTTIIPILFAWTSTADTVTSTVSSWNTGTSGPTMTSASLVPAGGTGGYSSSISNFTCTSGATSYTLTSGWQIFNTTFSMPCQASSAVTNLGVMFYAPASNIAAGDAFFITNVKLEEGTSATPFIADSTIEALRCKRFFDKSFLAATMPAQNIGAGTGELYFPATKASTTTNESSTVPFTTLMRVAPAVTLYSPSAATAQVYDKTAGGACTSSTAVNISDRGFAINTTANSSTAVSNILTVHWSATADL